MLREAPFGVDIWSVRNFLIRVIDFSHTRFYYRSTAVIEREERDGEGRDATCDNAARHGASQKIRHICRKYRGGPQDPHSDVYDPMRRGAEAPVRTQREGYEDRQ